MASGVENRVVSMTFDNGAFEERVAQTIKSLGELNRSLDFSKSTIGLSDTFKNLGDVTKNLDFSKPTNSLAELNRTSKGFDTRAITSSIENVSAKFIAMSTIAVTALSTITSKVIDTGMHITKMLSLEPVLGGFQEYETNMKSIQTILANTDSKGTTLDQVNAALDQLNEYSDQTIYNFSEMARNIGTFTAAGVDLDTSVNSIKGIANLAAISGSNSMQASTAMYQLSQAIAAGSVKLMDWNSVVNAGMGGEVFKKALFETGKSLKTIANVPIDTTFEEWEASGNNFRTSLETGWITAEVLTNTLQSFTGDLTAAQLTALGYTEAQATEMIRLGKLGKAAATEVKTLTQLFSTVKESVASGWSQSFRIVIGDFEEAKALFTSINTAISGFIESSATARNELLQQWKNIGGRANLIEALSDAFKAFGNILKPIQDAFRSVFNPVTANQLAMLTKKFSDFTEKLNPSKKTVEQIRIAFTGFFSALSMGFDIIKGVIGVFKDLFDALFPDDQTGALDFLAKIGQFFIDLRSSTEESNAIPEFFDRLSQNLIPLIDYLRIVIDTAKDVFNTLVETFSTGEFPGLSVLSDLLARVSQRFEALSETGSKLEGAAKNVINFLEPIKDALGDAWDYIKDWFKNLGARLAEVMEPGDFTAALDVFNVGLLAGIVVLLNKFVRSGFKFDFGNELLANLSDTFEQLTETLKALQANLRAQALLNIAVAIAVLAASVFVLSLLDSATLTRTLTAMAVGFAQLVSVFAVLNTLTTGTGAVKLPFVAGGLILLAGALLVLSVALKILATMSWDELQRGLAAVTGLLAVLTPAVILISRYSGPMIQAGAGILLIAIAMNVLALAMKIFATMSWEDIGKGLAGVAGSLLAIGLAMQLMPKTLPLTAAGLVLVSIALNLIASAMLVFATMEWESIGKGLAAVAASLGIIALAMNLMPKTLPLTAAGLVLVSVALNLIASAMLIFATMDWESIGRGLVAMAGALAILAIATNLMSGALLGAAAIAIVSASLLLLAIVMQTLSKLSLEEIGIALIAIAGAMLVLGLSALVLQPIIGTLLLLGAALTGIGAGFALFGVGALLLAEAFATVANSGEKGMKFIKDLLEYSIIFIPELTTALINSLAKLIVALIDAIPFIVKALAVLVIEILKAIVDLTPPLAKALIAVIKGLLDVIKASLPDIIDTGIEMILVLLQAIRDNIYRITELSILIITEFLTAITDRMPDIIKSATDLIVSFIQGITDNISLVVDAATRLIIEFLEEIGGAYLDIVAAGAKLIADIIIGIGQAAEDIVTAGANAIISFLEGVASNILLVIDAGFQIVIDFLNGLADSIEKNRSELASAGFNLLDAIFGGILSRAVDVISWFTSLPRKIVGWIGNTLSTLASKGYDLILGLWNGIQDRITGVTDWFKGLGDTIVGWIGKGLTVLEGIGKNLITGLWNGISGMKDWLKTKIEELVSWLPGWVKDMLGINSPSKVFAEIGKNVVSGLAVGVGSMNGVIQTSMRSLSDNVVKNFDPDASALTTTLTSALNSAVSSLEGTDEFNPVITPVIDLSGVTRDAKAFGKTLSFNDLSSSLSYGQARYISTAENTRRLQETEAVETTRDINFNQVINAPTELSTNDIYRQTRSQIALAKQELSIL